MRHRLVPFLAVLAALLSPGRAAHAAGDAGVRLEILVDGRAVSEHRARGTTYVEALRGREFSVRVTNLEPSRVAVAVSVDGRNVIDAKRTSALEARKWVLEPWQSIVLDGWQVNGNQARKFFFTTEERSYAAWLGDVSNAGVVEAVAFRERWNEVRFTPGGYVTYNDGDAGAAADGPSSERAGGGVAGGVLGGTLGAPAPGSASAPRTESAQAKAVERARRDAPAEDASATAAATGIGRYVDHEVTTIRFEHESTPCGTARVRYGYRDELVRLGVLPPWRPPVDRRESARGFSGGGYCPSP